MTRELLEDYPHICAEIQDLEREMHEPELVAPAWARLLTGGVDV